MTLAFLGASAVLLLPLRVVTDRNRSGSFLARSPRANKRPAEAFSSA